MIKASFLAVNDSKYEIPDSRTLTQLHYVTLMPSYK
jgi:hypothetical protein